MFKIGTRLPGATAVLIQGVCRAVLTEKCAAAMLVRSMWCGVTVVW